MRNVLIIDDEIIARKMLRESISWEEHGYTICAEARNGREGLEKTLQYRPDLVFADIKMPVMDGLAYLKQINEMGIRTKVVMLTCYNEFEYVREALRFGASDYLTKHTFEGPELEKLLEKVEDQIAAEDLYGEGIELLGEETLHKIIDSDLPEEEIAMYVKAGILPCAVPRFMVISYQLQNVHENRKKDVDEVFSILSKKHGIEEGIKSVWSLCSENRNYLIIFAEKGASASAIKKAVGSLLHALAAALQEHRMIGYTGITWKMYVGWKSLPQAIKETTDTSFAENSHTRYSAKTIMALEYIKDHYAKPLSLEEIADHVGISRVYLSQSFKKETGKNISAYIAEYRVKMAKNLLLTSNLKIYTISELCGFGSIQYFNKIFKKMTGISPNQFKNSETQELREIS